MTSPSSDPPTGEGEPVSASGQSTASSIKETLMKNPSVMHLLNPTCKKSTNPPFSPPTTQVLFKFVDQEQTAEQSHEHQSYFCFASLGGTIVGRMATGCYGQDPSSMAAIQIVTKVSRIVESAPVERSVTLLIKGGSQRLLELLLESTKDPLKLAPPLQTTSTTSLRAAFRECCIPFQRPSGLRENLLRSIEHIHTNATPSLMSSTISSSKKSKAVKSGSLGVANGPRPFRSIAPLPPASALPDLANAKQCSSCGSRGTPQWRRGPEGAGTLCNACGVKWKHGKLLPVPSSSLPIATKREITQDAPPPAAPNPTAKVTAIPLKKRKFMQSNGSIKPPQ